MKMDPQPIKVRRVRYPYLPKKGHLCWQSGRVFRVFEPDAYGACHIQYIRRTKSMNGRSIMEIIERICRRIPLAKSITLQDSAMKYCGSYSFDLSFRERLTTGLSWYENQGFRAEPRLPVTILERAMKTFCMIPAFHILKTIAEQNKLLHMGNTDIRPVQGAFLWDDKRAILPRDALLRRRRALQRLLSVGSSSSDSHVTLGSWLPSLSCREYSFFMNTMYGHMHATENDPTAAIASVGGMETPSVPEFKRANLPRLLSHTTIWRKKL